VWMAVGAFLLFVMPMLDANRERTELQRAEVAALSEVQIDLHAVRSGVAREPAVNAAEIEEIKATLRDVVGAMSDYGQHLRSHTQILKGMSEASRDLAQVVAELDARLSTASPSGGASDVPGPLSGRTPSRSRRPRRLRP
jgi:hypothetical protein